MNSRKSSRTHLVKNIVKSRQTRAFVGVTSGLCRGDAVASVCKGYVAKRCVSSLHQRNDQGTAGGDRSCR
jgi:hypothetical protein